MANERQTLSHVTNQVRMSTSRATIRDFDDDHDMQQVKQADVYHSETPSDFERWQMVGLTATPLKQDEDEDQQQGQQGQQGGQQGGGGGEQGEDGDWNHKQPKGPAAEAIMMYPGAQRSHPIAMVDDRRVRPYKVPAGASAFYSASGTGQMVYHNDDGSSLVTTNNPKYGKDEKEKERYASMRHVNKKPQERKFKQQQSGKDGGGSGGGSGGGASAGGASAGGASVSARAGESGGSGGSGGGGGGGSKEYKHEGEEINTEIRCTKGRIEFRVGDDVVGYYDKEKKKWSFTGDEIVTIGKTKLGSEDAASPVYGMTDGVGNIIDGEAKDAVFVNATKPGPPTALDTEP